jgi:N-acetylmuramoyl-L-alanine amidase
LKEAALVMPTIVIDAGHGGDQPRGRSSPFGVRGPSGTLEKDVTLRLARKLAAALPSSVSTHLTRERDENRSLAERVAVARSNNADVFVSLHANEGPAGRRSAETWVHDRAGHAASHLASAIGIELGVPDVHRGALAVLDPSRMSARGACIVEVDSLGDPAGEATLRDDRTLDALAEKIARGIVNHLRSASRHAHHGAPPASPQSYGAPVPRTCTAAPGYNYAGVSKSIAGLTGFCATITTHATMLPCEGTASFGAHSDGWTGIKQGSNTLWAQMGYTRERASGATAVSYVRYVEIKAGTGASDFHYVTVPMDPPGHAHTYVGRLDNRTGKWEMLYDGTVVDTWTHTGWQRQSGDRIDYNAELFDENSQMIGTRSNHAVFSQCMYRTGAGSFAAAGIAASDVTSSDSTRWGASRVSGTSFEVWDKRYS